MGSLITHTDRCLLVAAAPKEVGAVLGAFSVAQPSKIIHGTPIPLNDRFDLVQSGVGKASAAAATARALTIENYRSMISVGIAGSLPASNPPAIGKSIVATRSCFSDEGIGSPDGFKPMSDLGFAPFNTGKMYIDHDQELLETLEQITDSSGTIATVSWCSGDDGCARGVVDRTGAIAEAMEGAACAVAAQMVDPSIRTGELRVISNTTGHRAKQVWDLELAITNLKEVLGRLRR